MAQGNSVVLVGNLTKDPELRFTASGTAVTSGSIAVNERKKEGDEWVDVPSFFDFVVWQDQAEHVSESLGKGVRVILQGKLQTRTWEDDEKNKHYRTEVVVDEIGPALRWATANVTKASGGSGGGKGKPAAKAAPVDDGDPF